MPDDISRGRPLERTSQDGKTKPKGRCRGCLLAFAINLEPQESFTCQRADYRLLQTSFDARSTRRIPAKRGWVSQRHTAKRYSTAADPFEFGKIQIFKLRSALRRRPKPATLWRDPAYRGRREQLGDRCNPCPQIKETNDSRHKATASESNSLVSVFVSSSPPAQISFGRQIRRALAKRRSHSRGRGSYLTPSYLQGLASQSVGSTLQGVTPAGREARTRARSILPAPQVSFCRHPRAR